MVSAPTERAFPAVTAPELSRPSYAGAEGRSTFDAVARPEPSLSIAPTPKHRATLVVALTAGLVVGLGLTAWLTQREPEPRAVQSAPAVVQSAPAVVQGAPTGVQGAPTGMQGAPAVVQGAPTAVQAAPVRVQATPPVVQAAPRPVVAAVRPPRVVAPRAPEPAPVVLNAPPISPPPRQPPRAYNPEEP